MRSEPLVLLTRPEGESAGLMARLAAAGIASRELPCIRIEPLADPAPLRDALLALTADDLLVLTSPAGARAVAEALGGRACAAPVAVVGPATAGACAAAGTRPGFAIAIAIGPATADRVRALLGTEPVVATPDEDGLTYAIQSALEGHRAAIGR